MTLSPGTRLGHYEITSSIGRGGMGEVYRARDTRLGRDVAIKILRRETAADSSRLRRFAVEARAASALNHPHIVTVHDIGEHDGLPFIAMEYVEGRSLHDAISGGLSPKQIVSYATQIAEGLARAHDAGIVHRDLKPGNIMVAADGYVKILDFGLAKLRPPESDADSPTLQDDTLAGTMLGTLGYMSPEQARGAAVDFRSDQFSFGAVLYEMATGKAAFQRSSPAETLSAILRDTPPPLAATRQDLPHELGTVLERCLAKRAEERYPSTHSLVEMLRAIPASALGWSSSSIARAPAERRRFGWWLAAAVVLLVLSLVVTVEVLRRGGGETNVPAGSAVAVLPFENLTGNPQLSYIGSGLAASLISELSRLPALNVVGRTHAWGIRDKTASNAELAEALGVSTLIEGQLLTDDRGLLVEVAVIDGVSSVVLHTLSFQGTQARLYELQEDLVTAITRVLSVPLNPDDRRRLARGGPAAQAFDYYLQGLERVEAGSDLQLAVDLLRQAIRIDGDFAAFHATLSVALSSQQITGAVEGQADEAEAAARRALELDPALAEGSYALARALRLRGRYAESIAELRRVISQYPRPDRTFRELGLGYEETGELEAAAECYRTATLLGSDHWYNWNALGTFYARTGNLVEATSALEKAAELAPATVHNPRLNLGGVLMAQGEYAAAIDEFEATGATTSDPDLASNMASAYFFMNRVPEAERLFRLASNLRPKDHVLRRNLGDALEALGRDDESHREYERARQLVNERLAESPGDNSLLSDRALYAAKMDDCDTAVAAASELGPRLTKDWQNHLNLAGAFALCDRPQQALEAIEKCIESGLPGSVLRAQDELQSLAGNADFLELTAE